MQMEDDRISSLSDEILCHILSFLPTEDAFTTSFLSKRWTSLWLLLPNIDLDDHRLISKGKHDSLFPSLVFAAIFKRSVYNQPIKKLRLICAHRFLDEETLEYDFETWLSGAAEHKLEHLEIQLNLSHNLLCCIFSLRNLVVLKLKELSILTFSEVDFPLLKNLHLNYVNFGERWFLFELLNGCPILEDFEAKFIKLGNLSSSTNPVIKCLPNLVRANFSNLSMDAFSLEPFCCVESLCMVEVFGGNVPVFPNLTHVHLLYFTYVDWGLISDLLKNCCNLQHFDLEMPPFFTSLFYYSSGPSIFYECLSLRLQTCTIIDFIGEEYGMKFVRYILLYSTCLQRMKICIMPSLNPQMKLDIQQELLSFPKNSEACQIYLS